METERELLLREANEGMMAEMSLLRSMFARMEEREALATTGASGSGSRHRTGSRSTAPTAPAPAAPAPVAPAPVAPTPATSTGPAVVPLPKSKTLVTIGSIRADLGVSEDDRRWRDIRATIRDLMIRAGINIAEPWKHQDKSQLGLLYGMIRKRVPELRPFTNNWGAEYLVQETFNHRRSHRLHMHRQQYEAEKGPDAQAQPAKRKATRAPSSHSSDEDCASDTNGDRAAKRRRRALRASEERFLNTNAERAAPRAHESSYRIPHHPASPTPSVGAKPAPRRRAHESSSAGIPRAAVPSTQDASSAQSDRPHPRPRPPRAVTPATAPAAASPLRRRASPHRPVEPQTTYAAAQETMREDGDDDMDVDVDVDVAETMREGDSPRGSGGSARTRPLPARKAQSTSSRTLARVPAVLARPHSRSASLSAPPSQRNSSVEAPAPVLAALAALAPSSTLARSPSPVRAPLPPRVTAAVTPLPPRIAATPIGTRPNTRSARTIAPAVPASTSAPVTRSKIAAKKDPPAAAAKNDTINAKRKRGGKDAEPAPAAAKKSKNSVMGPGKGKGKNAPVERSSSGGPLPTDYGSNEEDEPADDEV